MLFGFPLAVVSFHFLGTIYFVLSVCRTMDLPVVVLIICSLVFTFLGNTISTVVLIQIKRKKEEMFPEMKQHLLVIFSAVEVTNVLGSVLVCPLWIAADKTDTEKSVHLDTLCMVLRFLFIVWLVCIAGLYTACATDRCVNSKRPFLYLIYKRNKETWIPYFVIFGCAALGVTTAIVSVTVPENPHNHYTAVQCILAWPAEKRGLTIFQLSLGFFAFSVMFILFLIFVTHYIREMRGSKIRKHRGGGKSFPRLPVGFLLTGSMILMPLVSWTPFLVVFTTSQFNHVSDLAGQVAFGLLFLPSVFGPLVRYLTYDDFRERLNHTFKLCYQCLTLFKSRT